MSLPPFPLSPSAPYRPLATSRSTSSTRPPSSEPAYPIATDIHIQQPVPANSCPYPSPTAEKYIAYGRTKSISPHRPAYFSQSTSLGFADLNAYQPPSPGLDAFKGDAFASLWERPDQAVPSNPWLRAKDQNVESEKQSAWAGFGGQSRTFGQVNPSWGQAFAERDARLPTPPAEEPEVEAMEDREEDEDQDEAMMVDDVLGDAPLEERERWPRSWDGLKQGAQGLGLTQLYERGRRKT